MGVRVKKVRRRVRARALVGLGLCGIIGARGEVGAAMGVHVAMRGRARVARGQAAVGESARDALRRGQGGFGRRARAGIGLEGPRGGSDGAGGGGA